MTTTAHDSLRIHDPLDLVALVPYMLGFTPTDSVVLVIMHEGKVRLTARVDAVHARSQVASLGQAVQNADGDGLALVAYAAAIDDDVCEDLTQLASALDQACVNPVEFIARVVVSPDDDLYEHLETGAAGAYSELRWRPAVAEMIGRGKAPARSREEIIARVAPGSEDLPTGFARGFALAMARIATWEPQNVAQAARDGLAELLATTEPDGKSLGLLAALMTRDAARLAALREIETSTARQHLALWSRLARVTDGDTALAPLLCAAISAWLSGDGVLLNASADTMHAILGEDATEDPDYWMLSPLEFISDKAFPPDGWAMLCERIHELHAQHAAQTKEEQR
ncbi:MAG: DUF4192 domain-containing protein [Actinomyces urogenitalis]|uniref:DUF4192 domain-containing protein n=1 Tax=Actinomyces urogenitalis TaxID=103621 RepID=UPI002A839342|nr:DUF4192 domain-containing protein [Actinomyces urogenitalis]MDY3678041.1 DUF4192 domain-containing protein [Actinomyces urogenitalis]